MRFLLTIISLIFLSHIAFAQNTSKQPPIAAQWSSDAEFSQWKPMAGCELSVKDSALHIKGTNNDPHFRCDDLNISAGWHKLTIKAKWKGRVGGQLFWGTKDHEFIESESVSFEERFGRGEDWREIKVYFHAKADIKSLRIDPHHKKGQHQYASITITQEEPKKIESIAASKMTLAKGFAVERVYSVPRKDEGSWVSMCVDPKGRLITSDQYGQLYRVTPSTENTETKVERIDLKIGMAQGMLWAFDSLYIVVNGRPFENPPGLYRIVDSNNDDMLDKVSLLREFKGGGEHGPHAVILSPDKKSLYVCGGNHTQIPNPEDSVVPRVWQEDQVLPRMVDAGGHATGIRAPGGWVAKTDPEGKSFELISIGFRNEYDIAFNAEGELFTYDADMEWDIGSPWYRPTRVCHVTSGSEFGWRTGTGKWPAYYPDSLPAVYDVGPGCPTGITFGTGAKFPAKYQKALFILDWSYGIIYAVHLEQKGASYSATAEAFCSAPALQATDIVVNPKDGAIYFTIGGRNTQSGLYRVTYTGSESTEPAKPETLNESFAKRKMLESMHKPNDAAIEKAWSDLNNKDRFIRFAARTAIEHQPAKAFAEKALTESDPVRRMNALLALIRTASNKEDAKNFVDGNAVINSLHEIDSDKLTETQQLELMRVYGLAMIRLKVSGDAAKAKIAKRYSSQYPSTDVTKNIELCRLLLAVDAPEAVSKTVELLKKADTQEEQLHYAMSLRTIKKGWTRQNHEDYFNWFLKSAVFQGGNSFSRFIANVRKEAVKNLPDSEKTALAELLAKKPKTVDPYAELKAREFVKKWSVSDLMADVEAMDIGDHDLANGKKIFAVAQCFKCHRFNQSGGIVGPDLTAAGRRFNTQSLLESIIEPSKTISDQYQATIFELASGKSVTGRVANLSGKSYRVIEDMLKPGKFTNVNSEEVDEMVPSPISMMPENLLDNFTKKEILDMIAYIKSGSIELSSKDGKGKAKGNKADADAQSSLHIQSTLRNAIVKKKVNSAEIPNLKTSFVSASTNAVASKTTAKTPNFIFVLSDDIAQGDLGCYGQKLIQTPRLDQMAKEGTRYMQAYCGTTVCAPSRSSFFTGLHCGHCPVRGNFEVAPEGQLPLPDETVTIAEVAKLNGYATATFGKWGMGFFDSSGSPMKQGVDHFYGYNCQRHAHSYFPTYLFDDDKPFLLPGNNGRNVGKTYAQELIQKDMIKWLKANGEKPFMMFYAITLPHGRHEIDKLDIYKDKPWTMKQKSYAAQVTRVDSDMGELMDTLRELGIAENTCIVFSGDNGSSFSPKSEIGKRFDQASNGLRGFKRGMYEGALRQAALAWWPGTIPAGRVDDQPWAFWDLMPTFVEMTDAKTPKNYKTDGHSLLSYLKGGEAPKRDYFYWELHEGKGLAKQATRFGDWKAVRNAPEMPIEIYNLKDDSGETKNLAGSRKDLVEKAATIFKESHTPDPNWPLNGKSAQHEKNSKEAWRIKRQRDKTGWAPPNAK